MSYRIAAVVGLLSLGPSAAGAHHSFAAEYDAEKPFKLTGTVALVEWANPHVYFNVDVKAEDGHLARWRFEAYPPNMLVRQGWQRDVTLKVGDTVTLTGWLARGEANLGAVRDITWADGHKLMAGPPAGTGGR